MEQPGSYIRKLRNHFFGLKYLNSLMRIRDGKIGSEIRDPGWKKVGSGINIPDPQHCTGVYDRRCVLGLYADFFSFVGEFVFLQY